MEKYKFTIKQQKKIMKTLNDYGIILIDDESSWNNIQLIEGEYFIEKLEEALNN